MLKPVNPSNGVALVAQRAIVGPLEHGEAVAFLRPHEPFVARVAVVEDCHRSAAHVAQLHAVADLVLRVDRPRQQVAVLREGEVSDVADAELLPARELAQDEIGAARAIGRCAGRTAGRLWGATRAAAFGRASGAGCLRRLTLESDPGRRVAREREAADARILALLARREIDDCHAALHGPPQAAKPLRIAAGGISCKRDKL